jgi:AraC-like DNA-binding protein
MADALINSLSSIVIFQLLLLSVFVLSIRKKSQNKTANVLLAIFLFILAVNVADGLLVYNGFYEKFPWLAHWEDGLVFLIGPLLYFYTKSVILSNFRFQTSDIVHAIPFIVFTALFQYFYHQQPEQLQESIQSHIREQTLPSAFYGGILLVYGHIFAYLYKAYKQVLFYRSRLKEKFSNTEKVNLNWLVFMLGSFGAILIVSLASTFIPLTILGAYIKVGIVVVILFILVFVTGTIWRVMKQDETFAILEEDREKYSGSNLSAIERQEVLTQLNLTMGKEKYFLQSDVTLDMLAQKIGTTSKKLSQVINENHQQNFFDYINTLRIEEAKRMMRNSRDPKITVLEIMFACGFNSKSSFNTLFKKKTGVTPSQYKKQPI